MDTEKQRAFIIHFLYFLIIFTLIFIFFRYVIYFIMPFLIGFAIAFMLRPVIKQLAKKTGGHDKTWAIITILLFYLTIGIFITLLSVKGFHVLRDFFENVPQLYEMYLQPLIDNILSSVENIWLNTDPVIASNIESFLNDISSSLTSMISSISKGAVSVISDFATRIPNMVISFFFAIISSFFISADYTHITSFIARQLPPKQRNIMFAIRHYISDTIMSFIIAYGKLMSLTFIELSIGLHFIGVENASVIAFIIAVFDVLPVLGTGGIMIPWILFSFINSQPKLAIGLLIIYLVVTIIRNIVEPKIVGKQIGLHPLLMLLCMYLGVKLFGFLGLFIMPFLILIIQNLNQEGLIRLYR